MPENNEKQLMKQFLVSLDVFVEVDQSKMFYLLHLKKVLPR